jgi:hypothetical protein
MKKDWVAAWLGVCFAVVSAPAFAHHGTVTTYDVSKTVVLKGTVTSFKFGNPHIEILLDVKDETGKVVNWNVEGPGVYTFSKAGWTRSALKPGDQLTATINPSRTGNPIGVALKLVTSAGKELVIEAGK